MKLNRYLSTQMTSPTYSGLLALATLSFGATTAVICLWSWALSPQPFFPKIHICGCIQALWFGGIPWLLDGGDTASLKPLFIGTLASLAIAIGTARIGCVAWVRK